MAPENKRIDELLAEAKLWDDFDAAKQVRDGKQMASLLIRIGFREEAAVSVVGRILAELQKRGS